MKTAALASILILALAIPPAAAEDSLPNPLVAKRADPYVLLHSDGWYYFCATVPEFDRIEIAKARDLSGLADAVPVTAWRAKRRGLAMERTIWAPELHRIDGAWYLYYASGTSLSPYDVRIRVLENRSDDPTSGVWADRGAVDTGKNTLCLDATTFEAGGTRYLVWAQRLTKSSSSSMDLYIARMASPTRLAGKAAMIGRADRPWEARDPSNLKMQGPAVLRRGGRIFIAYSSNATDARYCVGLMEAREGSDLLSAASWTKLPGPVLESDPAAGVYGPGHNSFTTSPDGSVDYIAYHARDYEKVADPAILDPNRSTRLQSFGWDAEGRPAFGRPRPSTR
jgi:GH43 family beta-xylosidase